MARVWVDTETDGLDPNGGHLFEVAAVATETDRGYAEVASQVWLIRPPNLEAVVAAMDPAVVQMHTASGLLADVARDGRPLAEAEAGLLAFLRYFRQSPPPGGNPSPARHNSTNCGFLCICRQVSGILIIA
jgi:oligoribonuclease